MDSDIASAINRQTARLVAEHLDELDIAHANLTPWHLAPIAATFLGDNAATNADRAWLFGLVAAGLTAGLWDGEPADADWDGLFSDLRAEIVARRDPRTSLAHVAEIPVRDGVGSR